MSPIHYVFLILFCYVMSIQLIKQRQSSNIFDFFFLYIHLFEIRIKNCGSYKQKEKKWLVTPLELSPLQFPKLPTYFSNGLYN